MVVLCVDWVGKVVVFFECGIGLGKNIEKSFRVDFLEGEVERVVRKRL